MGEQRDGSASQRLTRLQLFADELAGALRVDDVARVIVTAAIGALEASGAGVWIVNGDALLVVATEGTLDASAALDAQLASVIQTGLANAATTALVLPLATRGVVHGVVGITFAVARSLQPAERRLADSLAGQAAIAIERARLYDEADRRQRAAESTARRLEKLREAMEALACARTSKDVAKVTVEAGREAVDAIAATIWLLDPLDGLLKLAASHNVEQDTLAPFRVIRPDSRLPLVRVTSSRTPIFVEDDAAYARLVPDIYGHAKRTGRTQPFAVLPLATEDRVLGAIALTFAGPRHPFAADEREFLYGLTRTCEQALERARLLEVEADARHIAEAQNQRKDEFLAMLGHELRNPLAAMVSALDVIKLRDGALNRELTILDRHLGALVHMVSDLLDVSRVTLGKIELSRAPCDVAASVQDAVDSIRTELAARGHTLSVIVPAGLIVNADRDRLTQVLANLLANAVQYTPHGGIVEVRASDIGDDVRIEIRDNGVGLTTELMKTMFDAFVQGPRASDRREGGLGIGLTLVKQLVELHGGHVLAASAGDGKGSTFAIHWPKSVGARSTERMQRLSRPEPMRVLVIDHEVEVANVFGRAIEVMGHEVVVVHDSHDALSAAAGFSAQIVFLDLEVGGYELAGRLRELPSLAGARIVALGPRGSHDARRASDTGVEHHVTKPIDLLVLATLLG